MLNTIFKEDLPRSSCRHGSTAMLPGCIQTDPPHQMITLSKVKNGLPLSVFWISHFPGVQVAELEWWYKLEFIKRASGHLYRPYSGVDWKRWVQDTSIEWLSRNPTVACPLTQRGGGGDSGGGDSGGGYQPRVSMAPGCGVWCVVCGVWCVVCVFL